jgi:6-phosphogluconate dehydrogenase
MKADEMMKEALTLLHEDYKKGYNADWSATRLSAYAFLFGATLSVIDKKQAKHLLTVVEQYVDEQGKARNVK